MQIKIHQAHFIGCADQFRTVEGFIFEELLLFSVEGKASAVGEVVIGGKEKTAAAAAGVSNRLHRFGADTAHHCTNERTGRKILTGTAFDILSVFL